MGVMWDLLWAALLPLAGFLVLIFWGKRLGRLAGAVATALMAGSLGLAVVGLIQWVAKPEFNQAHHVEAATYHWLVLPGAATLPVGLLVDSLTVAMFTLVTVVGLLVHVFGMAYMAGDAKAPRFFALMQLLCFAMLALVLSDSLVQVFVFWGLVGAAAFLLIGFWHENRAPARGLVKAAIVNGVGDAFFLIGIGLIFWHVGGAGLNFYDASGKPAMATAVDRAVRSEMLSPGGAVGPGGASILEDFSRLAASENESVLYQNVGPRFLGLGWLTWAGLCLFGGAAAKAGQFPLHVWLPEAIEGPPPATAWMQSSVLVAAGVYLIARTYGIMTLDARLVIAVVGCVTLAMGALLALVQTDVRKLLACAVMSQAGYMMLFLGTGGYVAGLLHLFTTACFMACLVLGAGSVMHALGGERELRRMGGLWKRVPITAGAFLIAALALAGTPWFSGAVSRGMGMAGVYAYAQALAGGGGVGGGQARYAMILFWIPAVTSYVTAFYIGRCWWLIFGGWSRDEDLAEQAHENGWLTFPMILLAGLSLGVWYGGIFGMPSFMGKSVMATVPVLRVTDGAIDAAWAYAGWAFVAMLLAPLVYLRGFGFADRLRRLPALNLIHAWLRERMFFDALYAALVWTVTRTGRIAAHCEKAARRTRNAEW